MTYEIIEKVLSIVNSNSTWKVKRALLRELGIPKQLIDELVPGPDKADY